MIWFTWRQFRIPALSVAVPLLAVIAALALTWTQVTGLARETGFTGCLGDACGDAADAFLRAMQHNIAAPVNNAGNAALLVLPALLGIFWGAPLVAREIETGTYQMILTQTVSRRRWLLVKLAFGGGVAGLGAGLVSLVLSGWAAPIDLADNRIKPIIFASRGIVPIAYAALAFVIGVLIGLILRRTVAAMAVTLLVVAVVQVAALPGLHSLLARPVTTLTALNLDGRFLLLVHPSTHQAHLDAGADIPGAWILSRTTVTSTGAEFTGPVDPAACGSDLTRDPSATCRAWLATQHLRQEVTYVPGSSFWALQWREFGVLIALTAGLSWFSLWWFRRRLV